MRTINYLQQLNMAFKLVGFLFSLFCFTASFAQQLDIPKLDSFINHIENNNRGIGSVSVFKKGKELYNRSFGQNKLGDVHYNAATKYHIGSITKMITATLIFQLIEQNKLHLEDKLSLFYPNIPNAHKITIKNLLEHSSGLGDYTLKNDSLVWLTQKVNEQDIFNEIIKQGVSFQPSAKYEYSNSGYFLLTKIVEKLFGQDYATAVATKIGQPLQLTNLCSITDETKNTFDSYHFKNEWEKINDFEYSNVIGVGDMVSTTKDLNTFLYHLFQHKILQAKSVALMKPDKKKKVRFGKGLKLIPFYNEVFYGHAGDTYGTHSLVAYNEKDQIGICFAINGERFPHNDFAIGILSIIYGKDYEFPIFNTIALSSEDLDKFVGSYSNPDIPLKLLITKDEISLSGQLTGEPSFPLECYATNKFKFDPVKLKIEFSPEEKKLILSQDGQNIELKKE